MVLLLPQQDYTRYVTWVCHHFIRLECPPMLFNNEWLCPEHLESIHTQMEHEEEGKVTIKTILDLIDVPKWKDRG